MERINFIVRTEPQAEFLTTGKIVQNFSMNPVFVAFVETSRSSYRPVEDF